MFVWMRFGGSEMIYRREDVHQLGFSCPHDEVSEERLVLTIDRFVEGLDLGALHGRYSEAGTGYYDPGMMLKLWFFAYCDRSWHCREVAQRVRYDVRYRYFVGRHRPDFRTLNRFRKDHLDLLPDYFAALVEHCEELGLIDSSVVALDGTKLRANASGRKHAKHSLQQEINHRLAHDVRADELGSEEEVSEVAAEESAKPSNEGVSVTDPEARLMKTGEGTVRLCYNAQVVVDNRQLIVAAAVGTNADDRSSLPPLLEQAERQLGSTLGAIVADGGYYSGRNVKYAQERGLDVYIPSGKNRHGVFGQEQFEYDRANDRYRCPNGQWLKRGRQRRRNGVVKTTYQSTVRQCRDCPLKAACTRERYRRIEIAETYVYEQELAAKLASPPGQAIYARRRELVEPVFGNLKFNFGFTRFSLRGLTQVRGEFLLLCIAHNLKKLAQWRGCRQLEMAFSATIRFIMAYFQPYPAYFPNLRIVRNKIKLAGLWI
jgi:transposase/IS5 family transposase